MLSYSSFIFRFQNYFNACAVQSCSYTILVTDAAIEIITTLFGLIGGISKALFFSVPLVVMLVYAIIERFHRRHGQEQQQSSDESQLEAQVLSSKLCEQLYHVKTCLRHFNKL